mmetsp:Transcript_92190/g.177756  ORF Transcript_92190/g.177756 Transcript_92190/m.177756 type:complete len:83 (-) Transcript_92190:155-403(-)
MSPVRPMHPGLVDEATKQYEESSANASQESRGCRRQASVAAVAFASISKHGHDPLQVVDAWLPKTCNNEVEDGPKAIALFAT